MLRQRLRLISLFLGSILLSSCAAIYHLPNTISVPELTKQGDVSLYGGVGTNVGPRGSWFLESQAAVSPAPHLGLIGNVFVARSVYGTLNLNFGEIGAGYYNNLPGNGFIQGFILAGRGSTFLAEGDHYSLSAKYYRYAGEFNIGQKLQSKKHSNIATTLALSLRTGTYNYFGYSITPIGAPGFHPDQYDAEIGLAEFDGDIFFDPAFTLRTGSSKVQFQFQIMTSRAIKTGMKYVDDFTYSMGLYFNLSGKGSTDK